MTTEAIELTSHVKLKEILKRYLNTLVYIDDKFGLSLVSNDAEVSETAPERGRSRRTVIKKEDTLSLGDTIYSESSRTSERDQLSVLLERMQRKYPNIRLLPVKYTDINDRSYVEKSIKSSNLVVLDWQLAEGQGATGDRYTAVDAMLNIVMETSEQMRLLVVYTSDPEGAEEDFISKRFFDKFYSGNIAGKRYKYNIKDSSIIMLCKKVDFHVEDLIEAYAQLIIEQFGFFPVTFLDMLMKIDEKAGYLLKKFSQPFDSILLMQMEKSGLQYDDNTEIIKKLITNSVYDELICDSCIVDNLYQERINKLISLTAKSDQEIEECRDKAVDFMLARSTTDSKKIYKYFKLVSAIQIKRLISKIDNSPDNWMNSLMNFNAELVDIIIQIHTKEVFKEFDKLIEMTPKVTGQDDKVRALQTKMKQDVVKLFSLEIKKIVNDTSSLFLMLLCDNKVGTAISDLIANLKLKFYNNPDEIASICSFIEVDEKNKVTQKCNESMKNKLFPGDILYRKNANSYEFLICILPACQLFRPSKVEYIISFVKGEVQESTNFIKKDSEYISIIPHPETQDKLVCVKWRFHDTKHFDLKNNDKSEFATYKRPYRLTDDYFRQIMSEYNSFYAKVGVEDLFIKHSPELTKIFLK